MMDIAGELELLAIDLYDEGYHAGIQDPRWYAAWGRTMQRVANGEPYTDDIVINEYNKIKAH